MNIFVSETIRMLVLLGPHTTIVHHIPGRVRLRLQPSGISIARKLDLDRIREHVAGILNIRVNRLAGSVLIEYDCKRVNPRLWERLAGKKQPENASMLETELLELWKG